MTDFRKIANNTNYCPICDVWRLRSILFCFVTPTPANLEAYHFPSYLQNQTLDRDDTFLVCMAPDKSRYW